MQSTRSTSCNLYHFLLLLRDRLFIRENTMNLNPQNRTVKGEKMLKILEIIGDSAFSIAEILLFVGLAGGKTHGSMKKNWQQSSFGGGGQTRELIDFLRERKNFLTIISKLRRQGLVETKLDKLKLTQAGKQKLRKLISGCPYEIIKSDKLIVVIFDIPEKYKYDRQWLRNILKGMKFKMRQKSVWIGNCKLPATLLRDLKKKSLERYVDIFLAEKVGTLDI